MENQDFLMLGSSANYTTVETQRNYLFPPPSQLITCIVPRSPLGHLWSPEGVKRALGGADPFVRTFWEQNKGISFLLFSQLRQ